MEPGQHVGRRPDGDTSSAHGLVADQDGFEQIEIFRLPVFGQRQGGRHHHRARMADGLLMHIVEFEPMGRTAVGKGSHGRCGARTEAVGAADHGGRSITAGGQRMINGCLRPGLARSLNDAPHGVDHSIGGPVQESIFDPA